jgi:hypothetical protein
MPPAQLPKPGIKIDERTVFTFSVKAARKLQMITQYSL